MPELRGRRHRVAADLPCVHEARGAALHRRRDDHLVTRGTPERRAVGLRKLDLQRFLLDPDRPRRGLFLALAVDASIRNRESPRFVERALELRGRRNHLVADLPCVHEARSAVLHRRRDGHLVPLHAGNRRIGHREFDLQRQFVYRHGPRAVHRHFVGIHAAVSHRIGAHLVEGMLELRGGRNHLVADFPFVHDLLVAGHDRRRDEHLLARQAGDGLLLVRELHFQGRSLDRHRIVLSDLSGRVRSLETHVIGAFGLENIGHRSCRGRQFPIDEPAAAERSGALDHRLETHGVVNIGRHGGFRDGECHLRHDGRLFVRRVVATTSPHRSQSRQ